MNFFKISIKALPRSPLCARRCALAAIDLYLDLGLDPSLFVGHTHALYGLSLCSLLWPKILSVGADTIGCWPYKNPKRSPDRFIHLKTVNKFELRENKSNIR